MSTISGSANQSFSPAIIGVMVYQPCAALEGAFEASPDFQVTTIWNNGECDYKTFQPGEKDKAFAHACAIVEQTKRLRWVLGNAIAIDSYFFKNADNFAASVLLNLDVPMIAVDGRAYPRAFPYNACATSTDAAQTAAAIRQNANLLQTRPVTGIAPAIVPEKIVRLRPRPR